MSFLGLIAALLAVPATSDGLEPEVMEVHGLTQKDSAPDSASNIYLDQYSFESADLGELLARQHGVIVQRTGGLGSAARISLNGLSGEQIRYFVDGVPLELAGFQNGIQNLPVDLFNEVRIYRGVVPSRLGADALGGAIELKTDSDLSGTRAQAAYLLGSFGTHRVSASGSHAFGRSGFVRSFAFFDRTNNRFEIEAPVVNELGQVRTETVERFNDGYDASGASAEFGLSDDPTFGTLALRAFFSSTQKEIQNDPFGLRTFGEANRSSEVAGAIGRFDTQLGDRVRVFGSFGSTRTIARFSDQADCVYSWLGECVGPRAQPGELN
ncbi:MAG: TonB-dependent receptor plug domain-containing protein, partial [Myxococcota bacterium]